MASTKYTKLSPVLNILSMNTKGLYIYIINLSNRVFHNAPHINYRPDIGVCV